VIWIVISEAPATVMVQQVIDIPTDSLKKVKEMWRTGTGYRILHTELLDPEEVDPDMSEAELLEDSCWPAEAHELKAIGQRFWQKIKHLFVSY
jgi:hypothetical protein